MAKQQPQEERPFGVLERYWNDPAYRADLERDRARRQAEVYRKMDEGIARHAAKQAEGAE